MYKHFRNNFNIIKLVIATQYEPTHQYLIELPTIPQTMYKQENGGLMKENIPDYKCREIQRTFYWISKHFVLILVKVGLKLS